MPVKKLSRTAEKADSELNLAHSHSNKSIVDKLTEEHLASASAALHTDMKNVDKDAFREAVEATNLIPEDVASDDIAYVRTNKSWEQLHHAEILDRVVSRTPAHIVVEVNKSDKEDGTGQPVHSHYISLADKTIQNIEDIPNKLNKLGVANTPNLIIIGNPDGSVSRSSIDAGKVVTTDNLSSNVNNNSTTTAASASSVNQIHRRVEELSSGISSCRGCVVNAFTPQGKTTGVNKFNLVDGGRDYMNGEYVTLDIPLHTIIPAVFKVVLENPVASSGEISSLELISAGYYDIGIVSGNTYDICGSGQNGKVTISSFTTGDNSRVNTTLPAADDCVVGDIIYVMQDEDRDFQTSIYMCTKTDVSALESGKTWLYVTGIDKSNQIIRYS